MKRRRNDARLGFASAVVIVAAGYLISMFTNAKEQKNWGTPYHIIFSRVEGVEEGTKVYYNGRLVGRVRKLEVQSVRDPLSGADVPMRADLTISISPLRAGSVILTRSSQYKVEGGLWGGHWISIQYEPGEKVPENGSVLGESVPSFNHKLTHMVQNLDWMHDIVSHYKKQLGSGEKARERFKAMVSYWNYLAFDLRAQANKFNQFSGLINEQIGKAADSIDARVAAVRARGRLAVSQIQLYADTTRTVALQQSERTHTLVARLNAQMDAMKSVVRGLERFTARGDSMVVDLVETARTRVQEAEDMVAALRFISKNPALASQFRLLAANMRKGAASLRETVAALRARVGGSAPSKEPGPTPSPCAPGALPGSVDDDAMPTVGIPQPPASRPAPTDAVPAGAPSRAPAPLPTAVGPGASPSAP